MTPATKALISKASAPSRRIGPSLELRLELAVAARAIHHLADELAASRVDVVAARAAHGRDQAGVVDDLLERADLVFARTLELRARERIERNEIELRRHLAQQLDEFLR